MTAAEQENEVLAYYARESHGVIESEPLAGLRLSAFRAVRERLLRDGRLLATRDGRYKPAGPVVA